jgi:tetratricopeptide (TPR) repeat protein
LRNRTAIPFTFLLLLAAPAFAQDAKVAAKQHFDVGQREYNLGNFSVAAKEFEEAYRLFPSPALLFNLGQAQRMLGNNERALFFYRGFLRNMPSAPNRTEVEQWIADLEKAAARAAAPAATAPPAAQPGPPMVERKAPPPGKAPADRSGLRRAGYWTLGAGGAVLAAGVVFGVLAKKKADDVQSAGADGTVSFAETDGLRSNGETYEKLQIVSLIAGGAGAIAGGVMVYLGWPEKAPAQVALGPSALVLAGSF